MDVSVRVELAHERDFILGRLTVLPSRREVVRDDGEREVIEHRVMQVLVALSRAAGGIVTRDELTMLCWDGRVVGEDAIHRVISHLRKLANGIGAGSFEIETITKIGYRLTSDGNGPAEAGGVRLQEPLAGDRPAPAGRTSRRNLLAGVAAAGVLGVAGVAAYRRLSRPSVPPEVEQLMEQARQLRDQNTFEGQNQALGLYRRVVEIAPGYADGWGMLAVAYGIRSHFSPRAEGQTMRQRAQAAARRALELDSGNGYGELALGVALPFIGRWLERERHLVRALADKPRDGEVLYHRASSLQSVGRNREAVTLYQSIDQEPLTPAVYASYIQALWSAGRIEEAERLLNDAASLYPTHTNMWFARVHMLMDSGRPGAAIAFMQDRDRWPTSTPADQIADLVSVARALQSRDPAQVDAMMAKRSAQARTYGYGAINAIRDACAFGRLDEAFAVADAYYFNRGFSVPDYPTPESGTSLDERQTRFLFAPITRPMRADPRFIRLTGELGLERFWRETGIPPDYRRS